MSPHERYYYINNETGVSQWEEPEGYNTPQDSQAPKHYRLKAKSDVFCVGNIYFVNLSTLKKLVSYLSYYILKSHILLTVHVFFSEKWNLYICKRLSDQADDTPITGAQ